VRRDEAIVMALFLRALLASVALLNLVPSAWAPEPPKPGKQHDHLKRLVGSEAPAYEAYAVRFATLRGCPLANLVKGADPARKIDLAMTLWVLKNPGGRTVLVDAGFYRQEVLKVFGALHINSVFRRIIVQTGELLCRRVWHGSSGIVGEEAPPSGKYDDRGHGGIANPPKVGVDLASETCREDAHDHCQPQTDREIEKSNQSAAHAVILATDSSGWHGSYLPAIAKPMAAKVPTEKSTARSRVAGLRV
jgi:hypothetical protein